MTQIQKRKTIESELVESKKLAIRTLEETPVIKEFKRRELKEDILHGRGDKLLRDKVVSVRETERV